jgi:hypothetical protein
VAGGLQLDQQFGNERGRMATALQRDRDRLGAEVGAAAARVSLRNEATAPSRCGGEVLGLYKVQNKSRDFFTSLITSMGTSQPCKVAPCFGPITLPICAAFHCVASRNVSVTSSENGMSGQA